MITDRTGSNTDITYLEIINAFWSQISVAPDMNSESKSIHKHMLSIYKCSVHTTYIYMHTHIYVYIVCTHTHIYILHIFIYNCILHILLHCISYIYNSHIHTYICLLCTHGYIASSWTLYALHIHRTNTAYPFSRIPWYPQEGGNAKDCVGYKQPLVSPTASVIPVIFFPSTFKKEFDITLRSLWGQRIRKKVLASVTWQT